MELRPQELVYQCEKCAECDQPIAGLPALKHLNTDNNEKRTMHVMCAPPRLRKAYHEAEAQASRGR